MSGVGRVAWLVSPGARLCSSRPLAGPSTGWGQWSTQATTSSAAFSAAVEQTTGERREATVEVLHVDEIISGEAFEEDNGAGPSVSLPDAKGGAGIDGTMPSPATPLKHVPLLKLDPFARSKVLNFLKKHSSHPHPPTAAGKPIFSAKTASVSADESRSEAAGSPFIVEKIQFDSRKTPDGDESDATGDENVEFRVTLRLPLPPQYGARVAEGLAGNVKDAELCAAMHAEHIIDALGFPLYSLQTSQRRHAEAARAAGRYAPMPDDAPRPPDTPSPAPFSYGQVRGGGANRSAKHLKQQHSAVFDADFDSVSIPSYSAHTARVASCAIGPAPYVVDESCVFRVRSFLRAYGRKTLQCSRLLSRVALVDASAKDGEKSVADRNDDLTKEFLCQIQLPIHERFGPRVASGKAVGSRRTAYVLACMHAELIIDTLGLKIFPSDAEMQGKHHADAAAAGRWCAAPTESTLYPDRPSPKPLQLAIASSSTEESSLDVEMRSLLVRAAAEQQTLLHIHFVDCKAEEDLTSYMARMGRGSRVFSVVRLGSQAGGAGSAPSHGRTFRATVVVPVQAAPASSSVEGLARLASEGTAAFVAIGIAQSSSGAVAVCAMHALQCLGALGIAVYGDDAAKQQAFYDRLTAAGGLAVNPKAATTAATTAPAALPHPMKLCDGSFTGRIWAGVDIRGETTSIPSFRDMQDAVIKGRTEHPGLQWDLADDDDHDLVPAEADRRLLVAPGATAGRNYVHTLYSPRLPCVRAWDRLRDYLERNGQEPEAAVKVKESPPALHDGQARSLFTASVQLPRRHNSASSVPADRLNLVAIGESYLSADDATMLCAMHAEILLDSHGLELYDHAGLQRQHAETAWGLGRHCPASWQHHSDARDAMPPPCPPLRRELPGSLRWAKSRWQRKPPSVQSPVHVSSSEGQAGIMQSSAFTDGVVPHPGTSDQIDYGSMRAVLSREANNPKVSDRISQYMEHRGRSLSSSMRKFIEKSADLGIVHHAQLDLPVPEQFGKRVAHGCASSAGMAYVLCLIHAQSIIDALQLPLFASPSAQLKHREFAVAHFHSIIPPRPSEPMAPGATPSPPPLKCIEGDICAPPVPQLPPTIRVGADEYLWKRYAHLVTEFLERQEDLLLRRAMSAGVLPSLGSAVEDAAMEKAQKIADSRKATDHVRDVCQERGFELPDKFRWEVIKLPRSSCGPTLLAKLSSGSGGGGGHKAGASERDASALPSTEQVVVYYSKQQVWGTPYHAHGWGRSHDEATNRAALHYSAIVLQICPHPTVSLSRNTLEGRAMDPTATVVPGCALESSKRHLVQLYFACQPPFRPVLLADRSRRATATGGSSSVAVLTYSDAAGLRSSEIGKSDVSFEDAASKAYALLHDKMLSQKRNFAALSHGLKGLPYMTGHAWAGVAMNMSRVWWIDAHRYAEQRHHQQCDSGKPQCDAPLLQNLSMDWKDSLRKDEVHMSPLSVLLAVFSFSSSNGDAAAAKMSAASRSPWLHTLRLTGLVVGANPVCSVLGQWIAVTAAQLSRRQETGSIPSQMSAFLKDESVVLAVASTLVHGALLGQFDVALTISAAAMVATQDEAVLDVLQEAMNFEKISSSALVEVDTAAQRRMEAISRMKTTLMMLLLPPSACSEEPRGRGGNSYGAAFETRFGSAKVTGLWPRYSVYLQRATSPSSSVGDRLRPALLSLLAALGCAPGGRLLLAPQPATETPLSASLDVNSSLGIQFTSSSTPTSAKIDVVVPKSLFALLSAPLTDGATQSSGSLHAAVYHLSGKDSNGLVPRAASPIFGSCRFLSTSSTFVKTVGDGELDVLVGEESILYFTNACGRIARGAADETAAGMTTVHRLHHLFRSLLENGQTVSMELLLLVLQL